MQPDAIKKTDIKTLLFPASVKEVFTHYVAQHCGNASPYQDFESKRYALAYKMHELLSLTASLDSQEGKEAKAILDFITAFREGKEPVALIKNFPVDSDLLTSPSQTTDYTVINEETLGKKGFLTEWSLTAINTLTGYIPACTEEIQQGMPFHRVVPQKGKESYASSLGVADFPWHTEATYRQDNDMGVFLVGLRNSNTPTILMTIDEVEALFTKTFSKEELALLEKPVFIFQSGVALNTGAMEHTRAMLTRDATGHYSEMQINTNKEKVFINKIAAKRYNLDSNAVETLLHKVQDLLENNKQGVILEHGDLLIFNNRKVIHSRTTVALEDQVAGLERYLMRTQSQKDKNMDISFLDRVTQSRENSNLAVSRT